MTEPTMHHQLVATVFAQLKRSKGVDFSIQTSQSLRPSAESAPSISSSQANELTILLSSALPPNTLTLQTSRQLSSRVIQNRYTLTSSISSFTSTLRIHSDLVAFEENHSFEVVLQLLPYSQSEHIPLGLAVFDLDSTLINQEVIDELARSIGVTHLVSAITERAMAGELDFAASLNERVALLKGVSADVWEDMKGQLTFATGARELCRALKRLWVKMAVLSGGFVQMAEWVKGELGLDYAFANHLSISPPTPTIPFPHLTGHLSPTHPIITASAKRCLLLEIAFSNSVPLSKALCVGDGANDLEMLAEVGKGGGMGVGFKAKERVQKMAPNRLNSESLVDLLYVFGYTEEEIEDLIKE